jgi:Putative transposase DNA-binding domain.
MIANMQCEIFPQGESYISKKEQIHIFNEKDSQKNAVRNFNEKIKEDIINHDFYVIGIDRGIKQLATLCVLDKQGKIQGDFEIYTRHFDNVKKEWVHKFLKKDGILDLSNLRVETTITGERVLVDLSSIKTKDAEGNLTKDNLQTIKLKQLSYIRKLQYKMQYDEENVIRFINKNTTEEQIRNNIGNLITPYKEGAKFADLPIDTFKNMFERYKECCDKNDENGKKELYELDAADKLKSGIVANMVGVIVFLLEKYDYKVFISLENLCRAYHCATNGMNRQCIASSFQDPEIDFKEQENLVLAGVGTYRFFEMQLLKKLFKIQTGTKVENFVPAFRSVDNYEKIIRSDKKTDDAEYTNYPFGIVSFVDPKNTSKKCPECGSVLVSRVNNVIKCKECKYSTANSNNNSHLGFIKNGDDNGAYHIAQKTFINLTKQQSK